MTTKKSIRDDKTFLELEGRLDTTTAPDFQIVLLRELEDEQELTLDFAKLVYVSSAGLRTLLAGQKVAKKSGKTMTLCNVSEEIMGVFKMTGFLNILTVE